MPKVVTELRMNMTRITSDDQTIFDKILVKIKPDGYLVVKEQVNGSNVHFHMWTSSPHSDQTLRKILKGILPHTKMLVKPWDGNLAYFFKGNKITKGNGFDYDLDYCVVTTNILPEAIEFHARTERDWIQSRAKPTISKHFAESLQEEFTTFLSTFKQQPLDRYCDMDETVLQTEHIVQGAEAFVKARHKIPQKHCLKNIVWGMLTKSGGEYSFAAELRREFLSS